MAFSSDSISLLFKAKGDTDQAKRSFADLRSSVTKDVKDIETSGTSGFGSLTTSLTGSSTAAGGLAAAMPGVGIAIAAVGAGLTAFVAIAQQAAVSLFNLTRSSAEYGSAIFDAQEKTGLSASTLTTLKVAADNAGSSLEGVVSSTAKFAKLIGEAADGSSTAQETLKKLGVTSYDLDEALSQVVKTVANAKEGTDQLVLAQLAFGRSGADLLPVIKQLGGDLDAARKQADDLGITLTQKDIVASDNFGDALGLLSAQAKAAGVAFTSDLMPALTGFFTTASQWYARNKDEVREWGTFTSNVVVGFVTTLVRGFQIIGEKAGWLRLYLAQVTFGVSELAIAVGKLYVQGLAKIGASVTGSGAVGSEGGGRVGGSGFKFPSVGSSGGGAAKARADAAAREAERQRQEDLRAQIELQKIALKEFEAAYKATMEKLREEFKRTGDVTAFVEGGTAAIQEFKEGAKTTFLEIFRLEDALVDKAKESYNEQLLRINKQNQLVHDFNEKQAADVSANNKLIQDANEKLATKNLEITRKEIAEREKLEATSLEKYRKRTVEELELEIKTSDNKILAISKVRAFILQNAKEDRDNQIVEYQAELARREEEIEREVSDAEDKYSQLETARSLYRERVKASEEEFQATLAEIEKKYAFPDSEAASDQPYGPFQSLIDGWNNFLEVVMGSGPTITQSVQTMAGIFTSAFGQMANAMGSVVSQWVLMGSTGPAVMRKILAQALASIAAEAAVRAIWELALGFAALFLNPAEAESHFIAAALFGSIAGVAALAGRAVAGNAFQQQTSGGYGQTSSSGQGRDSGGRVYSSRDDQIIDASRNTPESPAPAVRVDVGLKLDSDGVLDVIRDSVRSNGVMRQLIVNTV